MAANVTANPSQVEDFRAPSLPLALKIIPFVPLVLGRSVALDAVCGVLLTGVFVFYAFKPEFVAIIGFLLMYAPVLFMFTGGPSLASVFVLLGTVRAFTVHRSRIPFSGRDLLLVALLVATTWVLSIYIDALAMVVLALGFITLVASLREMRDPARVFVRGHLLWMTVVSGVTAVGYGLLNDSYIGGGRGPGDGVLRFTGTYSDPNYMAMMLCICLAFVWQMPRTPRWARLGLAVVLAASVFLTGSLTGTICLLLQLAAYAALRAVRGRPVGTMLVMIVSLGGVLALFVGLSSFGLLPDSLQTRLAGADAFAAEGDVSGLTSGRTGGQQAYIDFWSQQSTADQVLGGFGVSSMALSGSPFTEVGIAPHNTYLDVLFTVGLLGLLAWLAVIFMGIRVSWRQFMLDNDGIALSLLVGKFAWLVFGSALSMYPSWHHIFFVLVV